MSWQAWTRPFTNAKLSFARGLHQSKGATGPSTLRNLQTSSAAPRFSLLCRNSLLGCTGIQRRLLSGTVRRQPFDPRFFSSNAFKGAQLPQSLPVLSPPPVAMWLLGSSALVFAVIVVGGVTRLTESGLSITEWRPITGVLPPLSQAQWEEEFDKYKRTPEFKLCVATFTMTVQLTQPVRTA